MTTIDLSGRVYLYGILTFTGSTILIINQPSANILGLVLAKLVAHASKDIDTHLQQQVGNIKWDPILDNCNVITTVKIHHAHRYPFSCSRDTQEVIPCMRGLQVPPPTRHYIAPIADADEMPNIASTPVRKRNQEWNLVILFKSN